MKPIKPSYGQPRKPKHKKWTLKWAAPKAEWRRRWRCGGSWAAATINLTLHCVKLMLPSRHRLSRYTVRDEGAAICRRGTCTAGLWAQCTCSPTNRTFSVSVAKTLLQRRRTADWPPQVPAGARVRHLHVWKWAGMMGGTSIAAPCPKTKYDLIAKLRLTLYKSAYVCVCVWIRCCMREFLLR